MITKIAFALALLASASAATAGTIIEPIRYQFGQYNEVYYGGTANPALSSNNYTYIPGYLQPAYAAQRLNTPSLPGISGYQPYGPGTTFISPYSPDGPTNLTRTPYLYSDDIPGLEVGQFGYTINDVHNEAYRNAPRIVTGLQREPDATPAAAPAPPPAPVATDPRLKAIPLLNWAKAEHTRNPELYQALLTEAAKYDPDTVTKFRQQMDTKK